MKKIIFCFLFLTSCALFNPEPDSGTGKRPSDEDTIKIVKEYIEENYLDPDVKGLKIWQPVMGNVVFFTSAFSNSIRKGWIICFESNGKNAFGAYTGRKIGNIGIYDGNIGSKSGGLAKSVLVNSTHYCEGSPQIYPIKAK